MSFSKLARESRRRSRWRKVFETPYLLFRMVVQIAMLCFINGRRNTSRSLKSLKKDMNIHFHLSSLFSSSLPISSAPTSSLLDGTSLLLHSTAGPVSFLTSFSRVHLISRRSHSFFTRCSQRLLSSSSPSLV